MAIPETFTIKSNVFKAEDLAIHDTIFVPQNSPISEAIIAIKRSVNNPFLDNPVFKIIAAKKFEIIKKDSAVEYTGPNAWTITLSQETCLLKRWNQHGFSININQHASPVDAPESFCQIL